MLNIGFIGVGGIAQEHLKHVSECSYARVAAVCDINESAAKGSASRFNATAYTSHEVMLEQEQLDGVFICVPPFAHAGIEYAVIQRGIPIFVEKPVGLDMPTVHQIQAAIRNQGLLNGTGYCLRYWDIVQEAKQYLANKQIAMVVGYYNTSFVQTPWWREKAKSGGQLVEQTTHIVDLMRYLGGEVSSVQAFMSLTVSNHIESLDIPDVTTVNLQFQHGAVGHIHTTFLQPDHRSGIEIYGPGFRVIVDGGKLTIVERDQTVTKSSKNNFYQTQDQAFLEAIRTKDASLILAPYEEAAKTLAITLAANESANTNTIVAI